MKNHSKLPPLFPTDLPGLEWVDFEAEGFRSPVTGVVYRDGSAERGVPLGALGTGFIALGTDGTLDYYSTIFNAYLERGHIAEEITGMGPTRPISSGPGRTSPH